jgi:hypothetical protein
VVVVCGSPRRKIVCERIADQQGFFHWELDFATVFARGGFDIQVGNPPWVRPRSDEDALLAEGDRTATNPSGNTYTYDLPFVTLDREADMRHAHAHFTRLQEAHP